MILYNSYALLLCVGTNKNIDNNKQTTIGVTSRLQSSFVVQSELSHH